MTEFGVDALEAELAIDPTIAALAAELGSKTVPRVAELAGEAEDEGPVEYAAIDARLTRARVGVLEESYFRIPLSFDQGGVVLEVLAEPYKVNLDSGAREMLRITFSTKAFDDKSDLPLTVVDEYFVDYSERRVYQFGGAIEGEASEGQTIQDVTWKVFSNSPPQTEYDSSAKVASTVYNDDYEQAVAIAIDGGQAKDGSRNLYNRLPWLFDTPREPVRHFAREHQE